VSGPGCPTGSQRPAFEALVGVHDLKLDVG
jgi:hypothetical protein